MKGKTAKKSPNIALSQPSVNMPGDAIISLRTELGNLLGKKLAAGVLFRFGYRCGEALAEHHSGSGESESSISESLPEIWTRTGLGAIVEIREISEDEMEIDIEESTEALAPGISEEPACDYTRGYLAGVVNQLTKKKFYCVEESCLSEGNKTCLFRLLVFPHKVYVSKKPQ